MNIQDILDSLGLDLNDPETRRGAIEAIEAILDSRTPAPDPDGFSGGGGGGGEIDIELDPDLIQPSIKHNQPPEGPEDVEIEDEDNILDKIQHNKTDFDDKSTSSKIDPDPEPSPDPDTDTEKPSGIKKDTEDSLVDKDENILEPENDTKGDPGDDLEPTAKVDPDADTEGSSGGDGDSEAEQLVDSEDGDSNEKTSDFDEPEEPTEDDLLDKGLKDIYGDEGKKSKQEARKIKRERTLVAAKKALADAKARNTSPALVRELEKSIEELESLTEAINKKLSELSDEEFNLMINRVFDAIEAVGDTSLTFSTDEEREMRAQEIKTDLSSSETQRELSAEDVAQIRAETQAVKAREKENNKYKPRSRGSFKGFQDFLNSLYRAIALQVHTEETRDDSWSAINRRYSGTGVLQPGKQIHDLPNKKIPVIDFYFDCSGSWTDSDINVGKKAVQSLIDMEEKGQIKINIYYFADNVYTDVQSARNEGCTGAWNNIIKNIITTNATNVIIMTDSDMENWWEGKYSGEDALKYTVPGYVWYLWRDGSNAPRLPRDLKGRGGTQQFSFSS